MEFLNSQKHRVGHWCGRCDKKKASVVCRTCQERYCTDCDHKLHEHIGITGKKDEHNRHWCDHVREQISSESSIHRHFAQAFALSSKFRHGPEKAKQRIKQYRAQQNRRKQEKKDVDWIKEAQEALVHVGEHGKKKAKTKYAPDPESTLCTECSKTNAVVSCHDCEGRFCQACDCLIHLGKRPEGGKPRVVPPHVKEHIRLKIGGNSSDNIDIRPCKFCMKRQRKAFEGKMKKKNAGKAFTNEKQKVEKELKDKAKKRKGEDDYGDDFEKDVDEYKDDFEADANTKKGGNKKESETKEQEEEEEFRCECEQLFPSRTSSARLVVKCVSCKETFTAHISGGTRSASIELGEDYYLHERRHRNELFALSNARTGAGAQLRANTEEGDEYMFAEHKRNLRGKQHLRRLECATNGCSCSSAEKMQEVRRRQNATGESSLRVEELRVKSKQEMRKERGGDKLAKALEAAAVEVQGGKDKHEQFKQEQLRLRKEHFAQRYVEKQRRKMERRARKTVTKDLRFELREEEKHNTASDGSDSSSEDEFEGDLDMQIGVMLKRLGILFEYGPEFAAKNVTMEQLSLMEKEELAEYVPKLGPRSRILRFLKSFKTKAQQRRLRTMLGTAVKRSKEQGRHHHKPLQPDSGHHAKAPAFEKPRLEVSYTTSRCQHHPTTRATEYNLSFRSEQEYRTSKAIAQVKSALEHISIIHQTEQQQRGKLHKKGCKCCLDKREARRLGMQKAKALMRSGWTAKEVRQAGLPLPGSQSSAGASKDEEDYNLLSDTHIHKRWFVNQSEQSVKKEERKIRGKNLAKGSSKNLYNSDHEAKEFNSGSDGEDYLATQANRYSLRDDQLLDDEERAAIIAMERTRFDFDAASGTLRPLPTQRVQMYQ